MLNEADTRAKLIDPKLHEAGWEEEHIQREHYFTKGRIFLIGDEYKRKQPKKADYLLRYTDSFPIAVIEAKDESRAPDDGMQQAKSYAEVLNVMFAYSSNGHGIEEFDRITNKQKSLKQLPSPDELWMRYAAFRFLEKSPQSTQTTQKAADQSSAYIIKEQHDPLLYPYYHEPGGMAPWYFQETAIKNVIERILKGDKSVLLTMATGTGKTFVAFQIAWKLVKSGKIRRVLFLTDRIFLRDQAYNTFGPFEDARALIEEGKAPKTRDIYFSIYQAMYGGEEENRLYQQYAHNFFDLIIIDECHRSGYGTWNAILKYFDTAIQLGMTATPKRDENIDTYEYFCKENDGNPAFIYSLGQGLDDGFLATYKVHKVKTNIDRDGLHIEDAKSQGAEIFCPADVEPRDYYQMEQFEREIVLPDRTKRICEHLASLLKTFGPTKKTMVFCVNMDHANEVAKRLQNRFSYLGFSNYAVRIVSEEPEAKTLLELFQDSEKQTPVVATTVDLLTTGVDVPSVKNIVFIKPVGSQVVFKQIMGRGSRTCDITDKFWFRIIDYTNATRLFDDWDRPTPVIVDKPKPEGPYNYFFQGILVDEETYDPIPDALITLLIGPNEQVQQRSDPFGNFAFKYLPKGEIQVHISAEGYRKRQITLATLPDSTTKIQIELRREKPAAAKIRIKGLTVNIAEETYLELEATGQQLTIEQYIDHSRQFILKKIPDVSKLQDTWVEPEKRKELISSLQEKGVYSEALASILKRPDADEFDILASVGFKKGLLSREERAGSFENIHQEFLNRYGPEAREVLEILLDKYRLGGIEEISPEIFRVTPFDKMGYAPGVAARFGGLDKLREALAEMQKLLYIAKEAA
jgi:type I restriction enzyme R subunit